MTRDKGPKAFILDVDGTLVDSNGLHAQAWQEAFANFGKEIDYDTIRHSIGKGGDLLVPDLLSAREIQRFGEELKEFRKKHFRDNFMTKVRAFPGVREALEQIRKRGLKLILASSADSDEVDHYVDLLGIAEMLDGSTSKSDADMSKPSPEIFQAALDIAGTPVESTATVGDTPYDILASHRIALPVFAVRSGGFEDEYLQKADLLFDSVPQIAERWDEIERYFRE